MWPRTGPCLLGAAIAVAFAGAGCVRAGGPRAPEIRAEAWLNSPPLTPDALRGKVILVDFWTFG
jgi:hypothetical protein